ncbi:unnamed protein product, partial [Discosporangium mesarthrocarpum]
RDNAPEKPVLDEEERATMPKRTRRRGASLGTPGQGGHSGPDFDHSAIGPRASDRFKQCVRRVESEQWDTDAWCMLVSEAQQGRSGNMGVKEVYRKFLKQFPTSGRYRRFLVQAEMEDGNLDAGDEVLREGLTECVSLELWLLYLERVMRSNLVGTGGKTAEDARQETIAAFELALKHMGHNAMSTPIWQEYLGYIKGWEERNPLDKGNKMTKLRKVYQRVICVPLENLDRLWRECEEFEMAGNEHLWKNKFSQEFQPRYQAAKAVFKERKLAWEGIDTNQLARPPHDGDEEQARQLRLWKRRIAYERGNPELADEEGLKSRVRHSYSQCLAHTRHFPEIWHDLAEFEFQSGEGEMAAEVYRKAVQVIPGSDLLRIAQADMEERRGLIEAADSLWKLFLRERNSTTGYIMYQRFVRRNMGKEAARRVFSSTRTLRKARKLGYQLYLAHASLEFHVNGEPDVAQRVLEYGLSQHASFITEPSYVLAYVEFLMQRNDNENLRVLFERVLDPSAMPPDKARPVWERFVELELCMASSGGNLDKVEAVEARMRQVYPDDTSLAGLSSLWRRCSVAGCGRRPESAVDAAFNERVIKAWADDRSRGRGRERVRERDRHRERNERG